MARRFYSAASHRIQSTTHSFIVGPLHLCPTRHHQSSCIPTTTTRLHHLALSEDQLGEPLLTGTNLTPLLSLHSAPATTHPATPPARALVTPPLAIPPLAIPPLAILLAHPHPSSPPPTGPHHYRRCILLQTRANGRGFDEWLGPSSRAPATLATAFAASIDARNDVVRLNGRTWAVVSARVVHANGCAEGLARACPPSQYLTLTSTWILDELNRLSALHHAEAVVHEEPPTPQEETGASNIATGSNAEDTTMGNKEDNSSIVKSSGHNSPKEIPSDIGGEPDDAEISQKEGVM
ncbi:hypothetical protein BD779DRAFT_1478212 [Infundibulicybe gibba]|nr:hypothetical protein BD779DRAFT_1478212 [Infundibulicybe gibba]